MATVFETKLIGNIGKDAVIKVMDNGVVAINFPVAHNRNWRDKKTGESRTNTTWINCTIWKRDGGNMGVIDYLKKGTLVELSGTPFSKGFLSEEGTIRTEIRLNVYKTNILRTTSQSPISAEELDVDEDANSLNESESFSSVNHQFTIEDEDF